MPRRRPKGASCARPSPVPARETSFIFPRRLSCLVRLVPRHSGFDRLAESRKLVLRDRERDASGLTWDSGNESATLQFDDHAVHARWGDAKEALHIGFGWRAAVDECVGMDEGEVLALG